MPERLKVVLMKVLLNDTHSMLMLVDLKEELTMMLLEERAR